MFKPSVLAIALWMVLLTLGASCTSDDSGPPSELDAAFDAARTSQFVAEYELTSEPPLDISIKSIRRVQDGLKIRVDVQVEGGVIAFLTQADGDLLCDERVKLCTRVRGAGDASSIGEGLRAGRTQGVDPFSNSAASGDCWRTSSTEFATETNCFSPSGVLLYSDGAYAQSVALSALSILTTGGSIQVEPLIRPDVQLEIVSLREEAPDDAEFTPPWPEVPFEGFAPKP